MTILSIINNQGLTPNGLHRTHSIGSPMRRIKILNKEDVSIDRQFWQEKTTEERLSAVEVLREQYYVIHGLTSTPRILKEVSIRERSK